MVGVNECSFRHSSVATKIPLLLYCGKIVFPLHSHKATFGPIFHFLILCRPAGVSTLEYPL